MLTGLLRAHLNCTLVTATACHAALTLASYAFCLLLAWASAIYLYKENAYSELRVCDLGLLRARLICTLGITTSCIINLDVEMLGSIGRGDRVGARPPACSRLSGRLQCSSPHLKPVSGRLALFRLGVLSAFGPSPSCSLRRVGAAFFLISLALLGASVLRLGSTACSSHLHVGYHNFLSCWLHLGLDCVLLTSHCGVRYISPRLNPLALIGFAFHY